MKTIFVEPPRSGSQLEGFDRPRRRESAIEAPELRAASNQSASNNLGQQQDKRLVLKLAESPAFRAYQRAFGDATGLPLALRPVEDWHLAHAGDRHQNKFCALVAQCSRSCAGCLQMQGHVCNKANGVPATLRCPFGMNETAVTVKLGDRTIGYLQTGQIFFKPPTATQTVAAVNRLRGLGLDVDEGEAAAAYESTPVRPRQTYGALVKLIEFFAGHIGALANQIVLQEEGAEPPQITRARQFIQEHYEENLSLNKVAQHVAISPFYFCKQFKRCLGITFTEYVSRVRVEKAKNLLLNPNHRVSEVAYQVGFESLTHFNRVFKRIIGESPTRYRQHIPTTLS